MSVYGVVPTPAASGTTTAFNVGQPYAAGTTRVFVNGLREPYTTYSESNPSTGQFTFNSAPSAGALIEVDFDLQATTTVTAEGTWTFNPDGYPEGSAMYYGPILWLAGSNPGQTGTGVCVFGPNGAQISVPPLAQGESGLGATMTVTSVTTLAAGSPATFTLTPTNSNGAGVSIAYNVAVGLPAGPQGPAFSTEILSASDLTGTPAQGYTIVYVPAQGSSPAQMAYAAMPFAAVYNATNIPDTGTTGGANRTLQPLSLGPFPWLWVPRVEAETVITGSSSSAQVNLVARLNNGTSNFNGTQVALGQGQAGTGPATVGTKSAFTTLMSGDAGAAVIPANSTVTVLLNCEQQDTTGAVYSTADTLYTVWVQPVGIIPSGGVASDVVGSGLNVATSSGSFSNTIGANDNYLVFGFCGSSSTTFLALTVAAAYGGEAMSYLGATESATGGSFTALYGLANPPSGPQTLSVSVTGGTVTGLVGDCVSFQYWSQTSGIYSTGGDSTAIATDAVYLSASQMAIAAMVSYGADTITPSGASGSVLYQKSAAGNGSLNFVLMTANGTGQNVQLTGSTAATQPWSTALVTLV